MSSTKIVTQQTNFLNGIIVTNGIESDNITNDGTINSKNIIAGSFSLTNGTPMVSQNLSIAHAIIFG